MRVLDKERALNDFAVQNAVREVTERLGDQGRILLRKSGTEPVLRVMVEAPTNEMCEENVDAVDCRDAPARFGCGGEVRC
mgnify:CR=1 FL=1